MPCQRACPHLDWKISGTRLDPWKIICLTPPGPLVIIHPDFSKSVRNSVQPMKSQLHACLPHPHFSTVVEVCEPKALRFNNLWAPQESEQEKTPTGLVQCPDGRPLPIAVFGHGLAADGAVQHLSLHGTDL